MFFICLRFTNFSCILRVLSRVFDSLILEYDSLFALAAHFVQV